ncbi:hypothetical protein ACLMJK_006162 [Lecanora helva]
MAFGDKPRNSEAGIGITNAEYRSLDSMHHTSYLFRYPEQDKMGDPWRVRQTGVYHRYSANVGKQSNLWIFFNPKRLSAFEKKVKDMDPSVLKCQDLNFLLLSSYLSNWRWYLGDLSAEFQSIVRLKHEPILPKA